MEELGIKIKELRNNAGLSLKVLANKVGTTASFISQVENNKTMPSLPILKKIADALGEKISYLLGEEPEKSSSFDYLLVRKEERKTIQNLGNGLKLQFLSTLDKSNILEPTIHIIEPNMISGTPPYQHDGQEFIYILKGKIELILSDKELILKEGDSCYFDSSYKHSLKNILSTGESHVLCISTPGYF